MTWNRPCITYPAANRLIQEEAAARLGFVGHTEIDGDKMTEAPGVTAPVARKLEAYARRLKLAGLAHGTTFIGGTAYEIEVGTGIHLFTVLSVNGKLLAEATA
jgi:hypothetical protein